MTLVDALIPIVVLRCSRTIYTGTTVLMIFKVILFENVKIISDLVGSNLPGVFGSCMDLDWLSLAWHRQL